ncbi:MAG TPA: c-type cytochrome [Aliidongia sp.]|nr:c-type cytochrome [Aliidongia sp.]
MSNIIALAILLIAAGMLVWASFRVRRAENAFLRWGGSGLMGVSALAAFVAAGFALAGLVRLHGRSAPVPEVRVAGTPEQIRRGQAIADGFCGACHSRTGTLTGGLDIGKDFPFDIGSLVSANLTPAGQLGHWSDGEIFRAVRNDIDADGHWLIVMSYTNAGRLSDEDTKALIAYIRSLPADGQETANPPDRLSLLGLMLLGAGELPSGKPVFTGAIAAPPKGPTQEYGEYILSYQDCRQCHGADLRGGVKGQLGPVGPDLDIVKAWTPAEFLATLRTGIDPAGHELSRQMPWRPIGKMDDEELTAVYEYLTHLTGSQSTSAR